jgi:hypothetical protein
MKIDFIPTVKDWINRRITERTTWDGIILVIAGVTYLIFKPIATIVAYGAIAYGVWTIWKKEK